MFSKFNILKSPSQSVENSKNENIAINLDDNIKKYEIDKTEHKDNENIVKKLDI